MEKFLADIGINVADFYNPEIYAGYTAAIAVFFITFVVLKIAKSIIVANLRKIADKTDNKLDDAVVDILDHLGLLFYISISIYAASRFIQLPEIGQAAMDYLLLLTIIYYSIRACQRFIDFFTDELIKQRKAEGGESEDISVIQLGNQILKYAVWVIAILLLISNAGFDITPLLAGASIGGIAIAFALQNILTDIFASFSIYFDKPFKVGDHIMIGADEGVVKSIGIKSTRIQALRGEELIISNKELTSVRINNFKRMDSRRIEFGVGVTYQTSPAKLEKIPKIVKKIIDGVKIAKFERCHFKGFGDSALDYLIVYRVQSHDLARYREAQQEINLGIVKEFAKERIEFAYPTQTILLQK